MTSILIGLGVGIVVFFGMYWLCDFDEFGASLGVGIVFGIFATLLSLSLRQDNDLLKQCLADGRKEYECVAMMRGHFQDR